MKKREKTIQTPASFLKRILAFAFDLIILEFVVVLPFKKIFLSDIPVDSLRVTAEFINANPEITSTLYVSSAVIAVLAIAYFAVLEWKFQQTLGKMLFGLYVTDKKSKRLGMAQCIFRNVFLIPLFPFILLWVTEPLFMLFTKERQRLLEIITKTRVVEYYKIE